jgi:acetyl esterase/lipase
MIFRYFTRQQARRVVAVAVGLIAVAVSPALGQQAGYGAMQACRADFRSHCAGTVPGGGRIIQCLLAHESQLSGNCRMALASQRPGSRDHMSTETSNAAGGSNRLPADVRIERDVAYGSAPQQRMDVYMPPNAKGAPVIVMVHGGGWAAGSKAAPGVVDNKVAHWVPRGFVFVSVETRLVPQANPLEQARDVAAALASVQRKAAGWGGDASKIVLMGHSADAHLVALVTADRSIAEKAGARPWAGTVALDSAAYNVVTIMERSHHPALYDNAFGADPNLWAKASPILQLKGKLPPMLLVCSSLRRDSCPQAQAFAKSADGRVKVLPVALRHGEINVELGQDSDYTRQVDAFLAAVGSR